MNIMKRNEFKSIYVEPCLEKRSDPNGAAADYIIYVDVDDDDDMLKLLKHGFYRSQIGYVHRGSRGSYVRGILTKVLWAWNGCLCT
jgi:hypothetical protein